MKTKRMASLMIITVFILTASLAVAGPGRWGGGAAEGWGMGTPYRGMYNRPRSNHIGKLSALKKLFPCAGDGGLAAVIKTEKETGRFIWGRPGIGTPG
jgi:hypothetical protein